eukprot:147000-Chlamydomonas_euryale.AAC.1
MQRIVAVLVKQRVGTEERTLQVDQTRPKGPALETLSSEPNESFQSRQVATTQAVMQKKRPALGILPRLYDTHMARGGTLTAHAGLRRA